MDSNKERLNFIEIRRNICDKCEHQKLLIGLKTCDKCGCVIWAKTQLKNSECPIGKWSKL